MKIQVVGIAWYRREDYDRLKAMFLDGEKLPASYDAWLIAAERVHDQIVSSGRSAVKTYIDPETFPSWCKANRHEMNAAGRTAYGNECAARNHGAH